jgi:hypothetical protein
MVGAKQLKTLGLSWFWPGPYVQQGRARGTCIASHQGACSGAATSGVGEEVWPPSPEWGD